MKKSAFVLIATFLTSLPAFAEQAAKVNPLVGTFHSASDVNQPVVVLEIAEGKKFKAQVKVSHAGKQLQSVTGHWAAKADMITFSSKAGRCVYDYRENIESGTESGPGLEYNGKPGKRPKYCAGIFRKK